jgi:hypothetical protein
MINFFKTIFKRENLPLTIAALGAFAIFIIDLLTGLSNEQLLASIVCLLGIVATGMLAERIGYFESITNSLKSISQSRPTTISKFYSSRRDLPGLEEELRNAKKEIFIVGNAMGWLTGGYQDPLTAKILNGCTVKLLLLNPTIKGKQNPLYPMFAEITNNVRFDAIASASVDSLRVWQKRISVENPEAATRLQVRFYSTLVTLVLMFLDTDSSTGKIRIELMPHKFEGRQRPSFDIQPEQGGELYSLLCTRYKELWDASALLSEIPITENHSTIINKRPVIEKKSL